VGKDDLTLDWGTKRMGRLPTFSLNSDYWGNMLAYYSKAGTIKEKSLGNWKHFVERVYKKSFFGN
jgi:hypothetical protein